MYLKIAAVLFLIFNLIIGSNTSYINKGPVQANLLASTSLFQNQGSLSDLVSKLVEFADSRRGGMVQIDSAALIRNLTERMRFEDIEPHVVRHNLKDPIILGSDSHLIEMIKYSNANLGDIQAHLGVYYLYLRSQEYQKALKYYLRYIDASVHSDKEIVIPLTDELSSQDIYDFILPYREESKKERPKINLTYPQLEFLFAEMIRKGKRLGWPKEMKGNAQSKVDHLLGTLLGESHWQEFPILNQAFTLGSLYLEPRQIRLRLALVILLHMIETINNESDYEYGDSPLFGYYHFPERRMPEVEMISNPENLAGGELIFYFGIELTGQGNIELDYLRGLIPYIPFDINSNAYKPSLLNGADLRYASLPKINLRRWNFRGAHFEGALLSKALFGNADLKSAHFEEAILEETHFTDRVEENIEDVMLAELEGAHFDRANLSGAHLESNDLSNIIFRDANLTRAHLDTYAPSLIVDFPWFVEDCKQYQRRIQNADFTNSKMVGSKIDLVVFDSCNLTNIDLTNATISETLISGDQSHTRLEGLNHFLFIDVDLRNSQLVSSDKEPFMSLERSDCREAILTGTFCIHYSVDLRGATLNNATLLLEGTSDSNFQGLDFKKTKLIFEGLEKTLDNTNFSQTNLENVDFSRLEEIDKVDFSEANLTGANFSKVRLQNVTFTGATLAKANLSEADLTEHDLSGLNLRSAILTNTILLDADLSGSDLRNADLLDADLRGTDLRDAKIEGADFTGAVVGADLDGYKTFILRSQLTSHPQLSNIKNPDALFSIFEDLVPNAEDKINSAI